MKWPYLTLALWRFGWGYVPGCRGRQTVWRWWKQEATFSKQMNGRVPYNSICSGRQYSGQNTTIIPCALIQRPRCMSVKHSWSPGIESQNRIPIQGSSSVVDSKITRGPLSLQQKQFWTKQKSFCSPTSVNLLQQLQTSSLAALYKNFVKLWFPNLWVSTVCRVVEFSVII